ncbi:MAG: hypothetical protein O3A00_27750, partial [Planctomycetota bacterium]|nr:hypothetical protein [Planctomycetota bacterium]
MTRAFLLLTFFALSSIAIAQPAPAPKAPVPAPKQPTNDEIAPELRRVYIPIDQLDAIFDRDKQGVVLSRDEFRRLYMAAKEADRLNPLPPQTLVFAKADYAARISGQHLLITAKLHFTQFVNGYRMLRLPLRGLSVEKAMLDEGPAQIGRNARDTSILELMNDAIGDHVLTLDLSAPLAAVGSDKVSAFGLPNIPVAQLSLTLPAGKHLIANSVGLQRQATVDQPANYVVSLGGKTELTLRITERGDQQVTDSLVFANTDFVVDVAPGEITWQAKTQLNVYGKPLDRLVFSVPNSLEIADVASTGQELADAKHGPRTDITIDYRQPFQDAREITFKGITSPGEEGRWSVPDLKLANVTSHTSRIVVRHPLGTRLRSVAETGVRTAEVTPRNRAPLPAERNLGARVFEAWQEDFVLTFETQPKEREILAKIDSVLNVRQSNVELTSQITLATLYAPLFEFEVQLPADWTVESVLSGGQRLEWRLVPRQAGSHSVRIELPQPLEPQQTRELTLKANRIIENWDADAVDRPAEFPLPEILLPDAGVSDGSYRLRADEDLDVVALDVRGLDPMSHGAHGERAAYRYQDSRFSARIEVSRKPSSITTECLVHTRLDQEGLRSHIECAVDLQGGGLRNLEVAVSAAVGDRARFSVASGIQIVEQKFDREIEIDGHSYRVWKLRFDRRLTGRHVLITDVEVARPTDGAIDAPKLRVLTAERESGFVVIEASGDQQLTITARDHRDRELPEVDQVDVIGSEVDYQPQERIVATYRFVNGQYSVTLGETRFEKSNVPTAVCHSLAIKSVLAKNGDIQNRAVAEFSAIGVQGIRVQLPDDATLWSTLLDGSPVVVRKLDGKYLVPLSGGDSESVRTLALFYRSQLADRMEGRGSIEQAPPRLAVDVGGDEQPLEVLDQSWTMDYPRDVHLTSSSGRFEPVSPLVRTDLLSFFQQSLSIPTAARATNTGIGLALIVAVVLAFWACFRKWRVKGVVALTVLGGVAGLSFVVMLATQGPTDL